MLQKTLNKPFHRELVTIGMSASCASGSSLCSSWPYLTAAI
jgi:hypothetical protein